MKTLQAVELKNEGNDYFKKGDYENALRCYGKAVEYDPGYRDAWNNIYITLLKQERTEEARKCKEILDKMANEPKTPPKELGFKHFSMVQKIFIVIITVLLVIAVVAATEALMGVGQRKTSGPTALDDLMNSLKGMSPVSLNVPGNNSTGAGIPSSMEMVSGSFDTVSNTLVAISPIGLDISGNNSGGHATPSPA
jgi:hypothetical protein